MALTKDQWFTKISAWVPSWFFEQSKYNVAYFKGIAKLFADAQAFSEAEVGDTFILDADPDSLSALGEERGVNQGASESQGSFASRVQHIVNVANPDALPGVISIALNNGVATVIENWQYGFFDDALFFDDYGARWLDQHKNYNFITVLAPLQTGGVDADIEAAVVAAIDDNKAFGVLADVLYDAT